MNIQRLSTDFNARLHVEQDTDALELNCLTVALPPYSSEPMLIYREGASLDALWADALAMIAHLRARPWKLIAPPDVFQPFGVITARNVDDVWREYEFRRELMLVWQFQTDPAYRERVEADPILHENGRAHELRVAALIRAWDLLDGAPRPISAPCPPLKPRH